VTQYQQPLDFRIGAAFRLAFGLLRQNWRKLLWIYTVFLLIPGVVLGELGDEPGEPLFGLFGEGVPFFDGAAGTLFTYFYQLPTAVFLSFALAALLAPDGKPWAGGMRAVVTVFLLQLAAPAMGILEQELAAKMPVAAMYYAVLLLSVLLTFAIGVITFVAPAVATTRFNPAFALGRSVSLVLPFWFRVTVLAATVAVLQTLAKSAEDWLQTTYQTPDATAMDWVTTVLQETIRSGYLIFAVALIAAASVLLHRAREGPTVTETADVFS
jgi:hypothetical protein